MKADHVIFVRKGTFEITRHFTQPDNCHLCGKLGGGALNSQTELNKEFERKAKRDEDFVVKRLINRERNSSKERLIMKGGEFYLK